VDGWPGVTVYAPAGLSELCELIETAPLSVDHRFILTSAESERLARRVVLFAMKDMAEHHPKGNWTLLAAIEAMRKVAPAAVREFERA
jgi:hypothetical protein